MNNFIKKFKPDNVNGVLVEVINQTDGTRSFYVEKWNNVYFSTKLITSIEVMMGRLSPDAMVKLEGKALDIYNDLIIDDIITDRIDW